MSLDDIRSALKNVKRSPTMDSDGIFFHYFSYDCIAIIFRLQLLFQSSLAESIVPDSFLVEFFSSIPKRGKDLKNFSNYRPNTVLYFFSNLFEHLLIPKINSLCDFTSLQFGFCKGFSCSQAHHILTCLMKDAIKTKSCLLCYG